MSSQKDYAKQAPGATGVDPSHPAHQVIKVVDGARGIVEPVGPRRKAIAICGFAASSRMAAPFEDPDWEIWGLNQLYRHVPRMDREFDIHANWAQDNVDGTDHPGWLRECGIPVYMSVREESIPTAVQYPVDDVIKHVAGVDYFTSTVSFMLGLAIREIDQQVEADCDALAAAAMRVAREAVHADNPAATPLTPQEIAESDEARAILLDPRRFAAWKRDRYAERKIGVFGIDLIVGEEYDFQKPCTEFFLGLAEARNIQIVIPPQSALLKHRWRYGYETEPQAFPIKLSEMKKREAALENERAQGIAKLNAMDGALAENRYWQQVFDLRSKNGVIKLNEDSSS